MDAVPQDFGLPDSAIVVTASRLPGAEPSPSSTLVDEERIEHLGTPTAVDYLRLAPSTAVATSGPAGSLTEVRIRGAEAYHTLLFIDGIRANDPAAGNAPRFELLNADIANRIAVVRGPQSALWGSEAIGGVVAFDGTIPAQTGYGASAEAGSLGFLRGSARAAIVTGDVGIGAAIGHQRSDGFDSFSGDGDRDGFRNTALRGMVRWQASDDVRVTLNGFHLAGRGEFDGFDPLTFLRADTLDESKNRLTAGRLAVSFGTTASDWSGSAAASLLGSRNVNFLADIEQNWTEGSRTLLDAQVNRRFVTGAVEHRIALAGTAGRETFEADDTAFGGFTAQDRSRRHEALTAEWRGDFGRIASADIAVRRDLFNRFEDATNWRAALTVRPMDILSLGVAYAEGIAQPTFFDLYGFFPGDFVGNPGLKPESSKGWEVSARLAKGDWSITAVAFRQRLADEILDVFDPDTFLSSTVNAEDKSRRNGFEVEAAWTVADWLRLTATYAYLDSEQPSFSGPVREIRRPKHSGSIAADGEAGKFSYGLSVAHVGDRKDTDFDLFPAAVVTLDSYWLASARVAYRVHPSVELFGRVANALDANYQDVVGYRTEGRGVFAGLRLAVDRRSSP